MCGIAGLVERDPRAKADVRTARAMARIQLHRGPDGGGTWVDGPVALGHRRLRIIDLSERGAQPMSTEDGRFVIVYNGEVYNFRELRGELEAEGIRFHSQSDTEVVLKLFANAGPASVRRLNGIFAFAVWDRQERTLFAARDPFGVKPFYYAYDSDRLLFASEAKALFEGGWIPKLEAERVPEQLLFGSVAGEETLFRGVKRLPQGGWLEARPGREPQVGVYSDSAPPEAMFASPEDAAEAVRVALKDAVIRQMFADVPVGSMCSGGLDSSGLTALCAERNEGVSTYCVRIAGPKYDETRYSRSVSRWCGTSHNILDCRDEDVARLLPTAIWLHDEPLTHPNSIAIMQIALLARDEVTVLLSGEGADEVFGGYMPHRRARLVDRLSRVPPGLLAIASRLAYGIGRVGAGRTVSAASQPDPPSRLVQLRAQAQREWVQDLLPGLEIRAPARISLARASWAEAQGDPTQAAILYDQKTYLCTLLDRQDKMCMGASIESRVPYLDLELSRLGNALGSGFKLRGGRDKAVLRDALAGLLPTSIVNRPKYAFGVPVGQWFQGRGELASHLDAVTDGELTKTGLFDSNELDRVVARARAGDRSVLYLAWNLLNLEIWMDTFLSGRSTPESRAVLPAWSEGRVRAAETSSA